MRGPPTGRCARSATTSSGRSRKPKTRTSIAASRDGVIYQRLVSAAFLFIFITVVLDMLAVGIIVPVLPSLITQFRGGDTASAATIYGLFATTWAAMQFVFSP